MKIPFDTFDKNQYPFIDDKHIGKLKPIAYGIVYNVPLICINDNENPEDKNTTAKFYCPFRMTNVDKARIFVKSVDTWSKPWVVDVFSYDEETQILSVTGNVGRDESGKTYELKMSIAYGKRFSNHSYPLDVIKDLFVNYYGLSYTTSNFNTTQFESELNNPLVQKDIGFYLDKEIEFWDLIHHISTKSGHHFFVDYDVSGKITAKVRDLTRAVSDIIPSSRIMNATDLRFEPEPQNVYSSVLTKFAKSVITDTWKSVVDDTYFQEVKREYRRIEPFEDETFLINTEDAQTRAYALATELRDASKVVDVEVEGGLNLDKYDTITISLQPDNLSSTSREFLGNRDCLVISTDPNPETKTNNLKVLVISNRTPLDSQGAVRSDSFETIEREKTGIEIQIENLAMQVEAVGLVQMTSETEPAGTVEGQAGVYQDMFFMWNGMQWVKQEAVYPKTKPILRYDCDTLAVVGGEYLSPIIDNSDNGNHSVSLVNVTPI